MDYTVIRDFSIALLIGALVGVERERSKAGESPVAFAGLRTFILLAEAGAVSAWLSLKVATPWIFVATLGAVAAAVLIGYVLENRAAPQGSIGMTTEVAAITVALLGGMVMYGFPEIAVALAIVTSSVLAFKQPL
ncbi:MAG TPA: MgtC/SapB family protein, partial [Vicinamibacteria bacterium]|nr:MgtC/SapB family protein [Vicinamibacteria bacterium]